jgi:hypothetical protein
MLSRINTQVLQALNGPKQTLQNNLKHVFDESTLRENSLVQHQRRQTDLNHLISRHTFENHRRLQSLVELILSSWNGWSFYKILVNGVSPVLGRPKNEIRGAVLIYRLIQNDVASFEWVFCCFQVMWTCWMGYGGFFSFKYSGNEPGIWGARYGLLYNEVNTFFVTWFNYVTYFAREIFSLAIVNVL